MKQQEFCLLLTVLNKCLIKNNYIKIFRGGIFLPLFLRGDMWIKKPEFIFIIFSFIFGLIMMFVTPPYLVPDEAAHLMRACEVADGIMYNKAPAQNVECDRYIQKGMNFVRPEKMHQCTGYSPVMYTFSALGLKAGMLWGGKVMFYLGRFANLLAWIILTALAIRITPVFKFPFLFAALMPMTLYELSLIHI